jgi:hypothetical protein
MSKEQFAEIMRDAPQPLEQQSIGAIEAVKEAVQAVAPGLSLDKILGDIGQEFSQMVKHGAHEASAALFNGSAFVMYPRVGREHEAQEDAREFNKVVEAPSVAPPQTPVVEREQQQGREM